MTTPESHSRPLGASWLSNRKGRYIEWLLEDERGRLEGLAPGADGAWPPTASGPIVISTGEANLWTGRVRQRARQDRPSADVAVGRLLRHAVGGVRVACAHSTRRTAGPCSRLI